MGGKKTGILKELAIEHGFIACGVAQARKLVEEATNLSNWLAAGFHGTMRYMENHFEKRLDPTLLVPGAKSVICFLYNYFPKEQQIDSTYKIAKYAYGEDYHVVIKDKLYALIPEIEKNYGAFNYRIFVDSAPVMERQWAALAGLGWIGKNSLLLRKGQGSFFFIATVVCDIELEPDVPISDHCGTCTACIDACPTQAIVQNGVVDANRCISYLTIERKDDIPTEFKGKMDDWIFGCDVCQDVCPWNRFSEPHLEPRLAPKEHWLNWDKNAWSSLTESEFLKPFSKSALLRAGYKKLKNSITFAR